MLVHHWSHPTTPAGPGWDIVQTGVVRLTTEKGFAARAALGEAEVIRVIVDDLTGTADYRTLHRWYIVETETPGQLLVWNGYISDQYIDRGDEGDLIFPSGTSRRWELEITQENTLLGFRVIQGAKTAAAGDRPEERPGARLRWLLSSPFLSTVYDHGLIDWTQLDAAELMNANDYRGSTAGDVLRDISLKTGFNHYARYRDASSDIELAFYDANESTLDTSSLRVSNAIADLAFNADGTANHASNLTWPPHHPVRLHRKGDRVAAGVLVQGANGIQSYGYNLDTSYRFGFRDLVAPDNNTNTQTQADLLRDRLLAQHAEQDERITGLRIQVPAANLNSVMHGQRMQAKFVHLPGWEAFRWARVINKSFSRPDNETQALYDVDLELSPQAPGPIIMAACNDVLGSTYRDGRTGWYDTGALIAGTTWRYEARNTAHDPLAITWPLATGGDPTSLFTWRVFAGPWSAGFAGPRADAAVVKNLSPLPLSQGTVPPFSALPLQTGTFTVPSGLTTANSFGFLVTANYAPGVVTIEECWEVRVWRI